MKRRRRVFSSLFVSTSMLFAAAVILHWHSHVNAAIPIQGRLPHSEATVQPFLEPPLYSRPATLSERKAAISSIMAQLNAFQKNDYVTAMTYQSIALKTTFPSAEAFRTMIHRGYPEFADFKMVKFGPAQADKRGDFMLIPVLVTGNDGVTVSALYMMSLENKAYRVQGVQSGFFGPHGPHPTGLS